MKQPYVSIVSGTYNRLSYLKRMIASARAATFSGIVLEFVIVDSGSTDGTEEWCMAQEDIQFIQQGKLLGAIKAFNEGAYAAHGRYVIMANDDIEFLPMAITRAVAYMDDNQNIGIGAFEQDRAGRGWHIELMPIIHPDGNRGSEIYGQVCIIPKWLGDKVGYWGDFGARTYGGDTLMSARCWEAGYPVGAIPGARIHDIALPDDELRVLNNTYDLGTGEHPDTAAYLRIYPKGPVIATEPQFTNEGPMPRLRVMYLPLMEPGHEKQKEQKRGLRDALSNIGLVREFDYMNIQAQSDNRTMVEQFKAELYAWQPDLLLTQLHSPREISAGLIRHVTRKLPRMITVNWNGDYWPDQLEGEEFLELAAAFDLQLMVNAEVLPTYQQRGIPAAQWDIAFEPDIRHEYELPEKHSCDVLFMGSAYSEDRQALAECLQSVDGLTTVFYGGGWEPEQPNTTYDFKINGFIMRHAKFVIGDSQWPNAYRFVSDRLFNALAAGGVVLVHQWFNGIEELGLEHEVNCLIWKDFAELREMMFTWQDKRKERRRVKIAAAGEALALERHSFDARVKELMGLLSKAVT